MSAALELAPKRRLRAQPTPPWSVVVLPGGAAAGGWQDEVRELFAQGAIEAARAVVEALPPTCDGVDRERWRDVLRPAQIIGTSPASGGTTAGFAWLAREGHHYRGRWVLLDEGRLVDSDFDVKALYSRHPDDVACEWTLIWVEAAA